MRTRHVHSTKLFDVCAHAAAFLQHYLRHLWVHVRKWIHTHMRAQAPKHVDTQTFTFTQHKRERARTSESERGREARLWVTGFVWRERPHQGC